MPRAALLDGPDTLRACSGRPGVLLPQAPPTTRKPGTASPDPLNYQTQKPPGKVLLLTFAEFTPGGEVPLWKPRLEKYFPSREGARPPGAESAYIARPVPGYGSPRSR
jgi:hypothetical protein